MLLQNSWICLKKNNEKHNELKGFTIYYFIITELKMTLQNNRHYHKFGQSIQEAPSRFLNR